MVQLVRESLFDRGAVAVVRLNGFPRSGDGKHRRLFAYVGPDVSTAELIRLLRETAEQLARSLPKEPQP